MIQIGFTNDMPEPFRYISKSIPLEVPSLCNTMLMDKRKTHEYKPKFKRGSTDILRDEKSNSVYYVFDEHNIDILA